MFSNFTLDARKALTLAKKERDELSNEFVSSEHLLLSILSIRCDLSKKLKEYNLTYKIIKEYVLKNNKQDKKTNWYFYSDALKNVLEKIIIDSKDLGEYISINNLFLSIINDSKCNANKILNELDIDINRINIDLQITKKKIKKSILDSISTNLNEESDKFDKIIGREKEINAIIEILNRKTKNNPILVGEAGVGKTAIVEELARRIANKEVPKNLLNKKIISIDTASIVSGTKYRGDFEDKLKKIINEVLVDENIILFIDEIHTIVGAGYSIDGGIDASNILKPYLARNKLSLIGATTYNEYSKTIEKDKALDRRFQKISIKEPSKKELKYILMKTKKSYEDYHKVIISEEIIDEIIRLSSKYVINKNEPDRSLDILDDVSTLVSLRELDEQNKINSLLKELDKIRNEKIKLIKNKKFKEAIILKSKEILLKEQIDHLKLKLIYKTKRKRITVSDVKEVLYRKVGIKNNIDLNILKNKIINQDKAIDTLIDITNRFKNDNRCYSLLFSGNTGVGKTYLAKEYSKLLTDKVIKLDMNEYILPENINKLIGSPPGYIGYNEETLLDKVKNNPYCVLILDEIEKCNKRVLDFFLNILDEGYACDNKGNKINFNNVIIIMTTNSLVKKEGIGFNNKIKNNFDSFSKEFINRIDEVVVFNDIDKYSVLKLLSRYNLSDEEVKDILNKSEYKIFGFRKLNRLLKKINLYS